VSGKLRHQEPVGFNSVITDGIKTLVLALMTLGLAFNWISWTDDQIAAVLGVLAATFAVISAVSSVLTRRQVTPLANPRDNDGNRLVKASQ
jgi:hypothetical protein